MIALLPLRDDALFAAAIDACRYVDAYAVIDVSLLPRDTLPMLMPRLQRRDADSDKDAATFSRRCSMMLAR